VAHATAIHVQGTKEDFHKLDEAVSKGPMPPEGLLIHLVRPSEEGFEVLDVWRQGRDAETFLKERLEPLLKDLDLTFSRVDGNNVWGMARTLSGNHGSPAQVSGDHSPLASARACRCRDRKSAEWRTEGG